MHRHRHYCRICHCIVLASYEYLFINTCTSILLIQKAYLYVSPEKHTKRIDIDTVVVFATEEFGCHVDGRPHDAARHHGFRFAESQVSDQTAIPLVQLFTCKIII